MKNRKEAAMRVLELRGLRRKQDRKFEEAHPEALKRRLSEEIKQQTEAFLKSGGKIKVLKGPEENKSYREKEGDKKERFVPKD